MKWRVFSLIASTRFGLPTNILDGGSRELRSLVVQLGRELDMSEAVVDKTNINITDPRIISKAGSHVR